MSKNDNVNQGRPTSPHIQIYGWNICSLTSILHRMTGVLLFLSVVIVSWYIVLFTYNYDKEGAVSLCECSWWNIFEYVAGGAMIAIIVAISYHASNGIRHLFWDIGKGFKICTAKFTGYLVLLTAFVIAASVLYSLYINNIFNF